MNHTRKAPLLGQVARCEHLGLRLGGPDMQNQPAASQPSSRQQPRGQSPPRQGEGVGGERYRKRAEWVGVECSGAPLPQSTFCDGGVIQSRPVLYTQVAAGHLKCGQCD